MRRLTRWFAGWAALALVLLTVVATMANAQATLTEGMLDRWLTTTEDFLPMQDVLDSLGQDSEVSKQYTSEEFAGLSVEKQNDIMDDILKEQGVYDEVYQVLKDNNWDRAGDYMRIGERLGKAIALNVQNQMLASLPPEQADMVKEMSGGDIDADPADVAFVSEHWEKIEAFMGQHMQQPALNSPE